MHQCPPPCETTNVCKFGKPTLTSRNAYAFEMYQRCAGQQIVAGMGQPIGIFFPSIIALLDIYGIDNIEDRIELFEKIQLIDNIRLRQSAHSETLGKKTPNIK